jgi:HEAT repeat protein
MAESKGRLVGLFTSFQLKSRDADTRRRAALSLGVRGKASAIASLQPLLEDPEWPVRQAAIEALGTIADPSAIPLLLETVRQADQVRDEAGANGLRAAAVEALGRIGSPGTDALLEALRDRHPKLRETAIAALGAVGGERAVSALSETLRDDRSSVRQAGAAALARAGGSAAVPALTGALAHKDPTTRRCAASALGTIDAPEAVNAARRAIADREKSVREAAVEALAAMGSQGAAAALVAEFPAADRELRGTIAARLKGMAWSPADAAGRVVHAALHGRFDEAAAEGAAAVDALVAVLADRDAAARRGAAAALGRVADPRAAGALVGLFKDADVPVRDAAIGAVAVIGLPAADALLEALRDRTATVRAAAAAALSQVGEGRVAAALIARLSGGSPAQHAGRELRVVQGREDLDDARDAADALGRLLEHSIRALPPDALRRCAGLADVIRIEAGETPGPGETVDLESVRQAAHDELSRRG